MKSHNLHAVALATLASVAVTAAPHGIPSSIGHSTAISHGQSRGSSASYPWVFENGTDTAHQTALATVDDIAQQAGYTTTSNSSSEEVWSAHHLGMPGMFARPTRSALRTFGRALRVKNVIYGTVSWHTRSIWVDLGQIGRAHV